MKKTALSKATQIFVISTSIGMITVNGLANALPINGLNTGEVSDSYPNLFAPAGVTFAIWGVIYFMLAMYVLYQAGLFQQGEGTEKGPLLNRVGILFSVSSLANTAWIFSWHYKIIFLSLALITVVLLSLIFINKEILKEKLSFRERFFIRLPFSLYFGWLTVATIANATTFFVATQWNGFGLSDITWTIIILIVGLIIGAAVMLRNKDMAYGLVLIWAYLGILIKHVSPSAFNGQYNTIIMTIFVCLVMFVLAEILLLYGQRTRAQQ